MKHNGNIKLLSQRSPRTATVCAATRRRRTSPGWTSRAAVGVCCRPGVRARRGGGGQPSPVNNSSSWRRSVGRRMTVSQCVRGIIVGIPQQEVSESLREIPDSSQPEAVRGSGQDLVPEQESQVEESQGWDRTRRPGGRPQQQDSCANTCPC